MLLAFSISPMGHGESVAEAVAEAVSIVRASGLPHETTSMFTTVEGSWDECMAVLKEASDAMLKYSGRVSLVAKADIRPGYENQLSDKVERVENILGTNSSARGV